MPKFGGSKRFGVPAYEAKKKKLTIAVIPTMAAPNMGEPHLFKNPIYDVKGNQYNNKPGPRAKAGIRIAVITIFSIFVIITAILCVFTLCLAVYPRNMLELSVQMNGGVPAGSGYK